MRSISSIPDCGALAVAVGALTSHPLEAYASVKLRVTAGSTGMPGPVVVEMTIFFR
ncbi:MAG: hypothetical protein JWR34_4742 [Mycobacterium sp.]|nr:hypothetical protein [Mycobacterium sp.]